ncbi:CCL3 protein, partial [Melanocharis versteri]|nr:CCL3 protein [Melanocharis versteri]
MRVLAAALAVLLLVAICSLADSRIAASSHKQETNATSCCFSYVSRPIPHSMIRSAYRTSSSCTKPGVVLVTRKRKICADPKARWVQQYLEHLEQ